MFGRKLRARAAQLERENKKLAEVLTWYADETNWRRRGNPQTPGGWTAAPTTLDRGKRARIGLAVTGHVIPSVLAEQSAIKQFAEEPGHVS